MGSCVWLFLVWVIVCSPLGELLSLFVSMHGDRVVCEVCGVLCVGLLLVEVCDVDCVFLVSPFLVALFLLLPSPMSVCTGE